MVDVRGRRADVMVLMEQQTSSVLYGTNRSSSVAVRCRKVAVWGRRADVMVMMAFCFTTADYAGGGEVIDCSQ